MASSESEPLVGSVILKHVLSSSIWGQSVESNVREPNDGSHYQRALSCVSTPDIEKICVNRMRELKYVFTDACQKRLGRKPSRQTFGRWLMERGLYLKDGEIVPCLSKSMPTISPCMRRELLHHLQRPPPFSPLNVYKEYFQHVQSELEKRPERALSVAPREATVLLDRIPAYIKLITTFDTETTTLKHVQDGCETTVKLLEPIVEKLIFTDVDKVCERMSRCSGDISKELAEMRSKARSAAGHSANGPVVIGWHSERCSSPERWNCHLSGQPRSSVTATDPAVHEQCPWLPPRPVQRCGKSVSNFVPAGRGWSKGRSQERKVAIDNLKAANTGPCQNCVSNSTPVPLVSCKTEKDTFQGLLTISSGRYSSQVSIMHYNKLEQLYKMTCSKFDPQLKYFPQRLLCMLKRYEALFGDMSAINLQGALPVKIFQCLHECLGVTMECFASPLNCFYPQYCSMFPDIDCVFGSRGSFYSFRPEEGSLSVNPPFCEEVIDHIATQMEDLLAASSRPLSFSIFIPEWRDPPTPGCLKLDNSRFKRCYSKMPAQSHQYRCGDQHLKTSLRQMEFTASFTTEVFFLQNDAGAKKWPVTGDVVESLRQAFCD